MIRRGLSWVRGNKEYLWAVLGLTLERVSRHHARRLQIRFDGKVTLPGTYRYEPRIQTGRKRGLFLEGALL